MKTRTQRGSTTVNLIWAVVTVVGLAAAAKLLFGYDATNLFRDAVSVVVTAMQDAIAWTGEQIQGWKDSK